jgi:hypothetical protein
MKPFRFFSTLMLALLLLPILAAGAATPTATQPFVSLREMSNPLTKRQQIVNEYKRRLAKIDPAAAPLANGYQYQTDVGKNPIDRWQTHYNQDQLARAYGKARLSVFDLVRTRTKDFENQNPVVAVLPMQVRAFHVQDLEPDELTKILADIQQAIVTDPDTGKRDLQLNGLAVDIKPTDDGFIIPRETFQIDGLAVGTDVEHVIEPYGQ